MKKLLLLLLLAAGIPPVAAIAQNTKPHNHRDSLLSRWVIDVNLLGGGASQTFTTANSTANYLNAVNTNTGQLKYSNGSSLGADAQLGFFFGKKRHFGIGAGIMYMEQHGDAELKNYHVEYQATDGNGNIFRQVVTGDNVKESITSKNINIPIVLKYKNRFSKHWGFTADAGAVINIQSQNAYTTHSSFDYEAIYKITQTDGGQISVYDNAPTPGAGDWLITKAEFLKNNPNGNVQEYFAAKRALGYIVGDGLNATSQSGTTTYKQFSVGLLLQPSINYFLSDHVALNFGAYYMLQPFTNNAQNGYRLTDGTTKYNSVLNNVTAVTNQSYGLNIGARFFLGRKRAPLAISAVDQYAPSVCGLCDGSMAFHGLTPNQPVVINYSLNGAPQAKYTATVQADGQAKMTGLCAGSYTDITATIKKRNAGTKPVTLIAPAIVLSVQNVSNPTATGTCDGSMIFNGSYTTGKVTVSYDLNGTHENYTTIINADHTISVHNLCEGRYSGITVRVNDCVASGADFMLTAPVPLPPAVVPVDVIDISTPILFEVNKTVIHTSSYPVIEEAAKELKENENARLTIDGHADASGPEPRNRVLSLKRANAVKTQLTKRGINANRLKTRGHGSSMPAATNKTAEGKHENRRAVMTMTPGK